MTVCAGALCLALSIGSVYRCSEAGTCAHIGWIERHYLDDATELWVISDGRHVLRLRARWDGEAFESWPDSDRLHVGARTLWRRR